jgi:hypothetical protein
LEKNELFLESVVQMDFDVGFIFLNSIHLFQNK